MAGALGVLSAIYVLLSTSILYNCVLAISRPFYEYYNMALHYFNELAFFFFLTNCMTFTDFVTDVSTRARTGSMLATFMFMILCINVMVCLISIIWTNRLQIKSSEEDHNDNRVIPTTIEAKTKPLAKHQQQVSQAPAS